LFLSRTFCGCFIIDPMTEPLKPLKWYRDLADKKARLSAGVFLVEGEKALRQILQNQPEAIIEIIAVDEPPPDLCVFPIRHLNKSQFDYISTTRTPQGLAAVVRIPGDTYSEKLPPEPGGKILLLEDIQDPGNTGTLIRTAAAFNFSGVVLSDKCADPFSPKILLACAGAEMSLWIRVTAQYQDMMKALQKEGYSVIAAEPGGNDSFNSMRQNKVILALGNEGSGLSKALLKTADYRVGIPIARGKAESLNVGVSGGILMYLSSKL
jgi:TrmH family RNA methyltransferase